MIITDEIEKPLAKIVFPIKQGQLHRTRICIIDNQHYTKNKQQGITRITILVYNRKKIESTFTI